MTSRCARKRELNQYASTRRAAWEDAQRQVAEANRRLGVDEREALEILLSSMRQQRVEDSDIHG